MDCVHRLVERQVARTPHATAVIAGGARTSYRALDARANQVAHALGAAGVAIEARVGVCCERGAGMIAAVLGVLKAGAAYVPIDPAYPDERIALIAGDARLAAVVTQRALGSRLAGLAPVVCVDDVDGPVGPPEVAVTADHAIYVLYTSGSTGRPKGVVGVHAAIANRLRWQDDVYPYAPGEVASARTPLGFVDAVAEVFAPLARGVPLVVLGDAAQRDPALAIAELAAAGATRIVVVPSLLAAILDGVPELARRAPRLRWWFVGGEPVPVALVDRFARAMPGRKLINIYGATELSGDATSFDFDDMPAGLTSAPIGRPLTGVHARVVDGALREVRDGEAGELCVSGVCVARGYLDRPALTRERFVPNPFPEGGALYRTGDLCRRLPGGDLQYLGRSDQLVKLRGMRVELGEVEALVGAVPGIAHAAAIARDDQLIAFYTGERAVPSHELRADLARRAPAHLVPDLAVQLDAFPVTASGKVDRAALAAWRPAAVATSEPPATDDERAVARAWEAVLDRAPIGRTQSFFDLGGSSLAAMRIIARLRDHHAIDLPVAALLEAPTIAGLAARITSHAPAVSGDAPAVRDQAATVRDQVATVRGPAARITGRAPRSPRRTAITVSGLPLPATLPLSYHQLPYWLFRALTGDTSIVAEVFAFSAPVDVERLQRAFSDTVAAFDALWMHYPRWRPVQHIAPRRTCRFEVHDHRSRLDPGVRQRESDANTTRPFDLDRPPHVHARLVRERDGDRLMLAVPHVATDMASLELFRRALQAHYAGRAEPRASTARQSDLVAATPRCLDVAEPRASTASLADVIAWERAGDARDDDADYWAAIATGPAWTVLPARLFAEGPVRAWSERIVPPAVIDGLCEHARRRASSLPIALIGAIYAAIGRVAAVDDPTLLVMIDKRDRAELRDVFANLTALMRCRAGGARAPVGAVAARVAAQLVASAEHADGMMRHPTRWNDFWREAPRPARAVVQRISAWVARRVPEARLAPDALAAYVFAMVPLPGRRPRGRRVLIAVNVLPEVAQGAPPAPAAMDGVSIASERTLPLMLRPGDLVVGSDPLLDRTLQIHVTRDARGVALNLYGGGLAPDGLAEVAAAIVGCLAELAGAAPRIAEAAP